MSPLQRPVILHVEDEQDLAELVRAAFERFGFRGTVLTTATVKDATQLIEKARLRGEPLDLIITDLRLPDGTGLDLVRHIKSNPAWSVTPIIVLSSDTDPKRVEDAYMLGVNSYVAKSRAKRSTLDVVRSLYEHWLQDARLPGTPSPDRLQEFLARTIATRGRHAEFFTRMAKKFADDDAQMAFWLAAALRESNLANLLSFVSNVTEADLPSDVLDGLDDLVRALERDLDAVERGLERTPVTTCEDAYRRALDIECGVMVEPIARATAHLFASMPVVMQTMKDLVFTNMDVVAAWIEAHAGDPSSRARAAHVRAEARRLADIYQAQLERTPPAPSSSNERALDH